MRNSLERRVESEGTEGTREQHGNNMVTTWLNRRTRREKEDVGVEKRRKRGGREAEERRKRGERRGRGCSL